MKKLTALVLIIAMLCCCAVAEGGAFFEECAAVMDSVNYMVSVQIDPNTGNYVSEGDLFVGAHEFVPDQEYAFFSEDGSQQAVLCADPESGEFRIIGFGTVDKEKFTTAVNCALCLPMILNNGGMDENGSAKIDEGVSEEYFAFLNWCDANYDDVVDALEKDRAFEASLNNLEYFHVQMVVQPVDGRTVFQINYYPGPYTEA